MGTPLAAPLDRRTWTRTLYLLVAGPVALAAALAMAATVVPWLLFAAIAFGVPALPRAGAGPERRTAPGRSRAERHERPGAWEPVWPRAWARMPGVWFAPALAVAWAAAGLERSLAGAVLGIGIPGPYPADGAHLTSLSRFLAGAADPAARRDAAYVLLAVPLGVLATLLALALSLVPALLVVLLPFLYPDDRIALGSLGGVAVDSWWRVLLCSLTGLVGVVLAAALLRRLGLLRARLAGALLRPAGSAELAARLAAPAAADRARRAAAARVAVADQRRIERDLHDGAQARLTAVIMGLGRARRRLASDPEAARPLVDEAYQEAQRALEELRDLARGVPPPILSDRGLDAAIPALTAHAAVPVDVDVQVPERPAAAVESAAYLIVVEALSNVTKHARASRARVSVGRVGDRLVVEVGDDGVGGADPADGTGLSGLADRAAALDGHLEVTSPPGGPTLVHAELPCGS
ncbi:MAG TPA: sensor domain-containing protein [Actinomycetes bacterium]